MATDRACAKFPAVWHRILAADTTRYELSSLRELDTGTSATPIELIRALKQRFPGTRHAHLLRLDGGRLGRLAPRRRRAAQAGQRGPAVARRRPALAEAGEICVRSAFLMDGYFEDPEATAAALRDGWFHTGDLGELDAEGYLSIVGPPEGRDPHRRRERHAGARWRRRCASIRRRGGRGGRRAGSAVGRDRVRGGGADGRRHADARRAAAPLRGRLAGFKKPRRLELVGALPRTAGHRPGAAGAARCSVGARPRVAHDGAPACACSRTCRSQLLEPVRQELSGRRAGTGADAGRSAGAERARRGAADARRGQPEPRRGRRARRALGAHLRHRRERLPLRGARRPAAHLLARRQRDPDRGVGAGRDARGREAAARDLDPRSRPRTGASRRSAACTGARSRWSDSAASARGGAARARRSACACARCGAATRRAPWPASRWCAISRALLADADHLVLAAPATPATRHLIDGDALAQREARPAPGQRGARRAGRSGGAARARSTTAASAWRRSTSWIPSRCPRATGSTRIRACGSARTSRGACPARFDVLIEPFLENLRRYRAGEPLQYQVDVASGY